MNESQINTRYAKALFKLAKEKKMLPVLQEDIKLILNAFNEIPELTSVMHDPVVKGSKKDAILKAVFKNRINSITTSFLNLLILNKRELYIKGIARHFLNLVKEEQGIKTVILTTAYQLHKETKAQLTLLIKKELKSEIDLTEEVNPELIGGFIVQVNDNLYDSSVRSALNKIEKNFLEADIKIKT